ncbi:MAG TPA: hypothetical protein VFE62_23515 [Gemmataceae bacterium]|nr:hypothetical protein [Gemmataceae bacterium]
MAILAAGLVALAVWPLEGIRVTVTNGGPQPLTDVVAHVSGSKHPIGNLAIGESRTVRVLPTTDSHLEVSFRDEIGKSRQLNPGGYFDQHCCGSIKVEIKNGEIVRNEHQIELSWF